MRALVISDVHANLEALEACLAAAPSCDLTVNLGDVVGYGAMPNQVSERVRELAHIHVRGNHDKVCSGLAPIEGFNPVAALAAQWTREALTSENIAWLRSLPQGPVVPTQLDGVECVHGSPLDEDEYLVVARDAMHVLETAAARITFFGHTHIQGGFGVADGRYSTIRPEYRGSDDSETYVLQLEAGSKYMINPGSVGQPRDGDWRAAFAVYDEAASSVTFFRVPYAVEQAQNRIFAAGLPERLGLRLREGR